MAETPSPVVASTSNLRASKYRPEIDGLRAFAVVAVIINHFNKDLLPSGYLGVDIFFVISGYVITSSLAGRESKNFLDFLTGFYERRIKRLVPALVVFVLISTVLICNFNANPDEAIKTGATSLLGISNLYLFYTSTDYFTQSTELNPFTHTWSLGVEEQFYLLFPFLIWFTGFGKQTAKGALNLFIWVGALTIASLIGFIYLYQVNQPAAYFLMLPRFWEMAAGCLIFVGFQKRARIEQMLEKVPPLIIVAAMIGVMFLPVKAAVPGTVGIVLLSAVQIACLKRGTAAYKLFTLEKIVFVGSISYSLYLWHWAVLSISRWTIGIHWWSMPIQITLMTLIAVVSYKWIELPARNSKWLPSRAGNIFLGLTTSSMICTITIMFARNPAKIPYAGELNDENKPLIDYKDKRTHINARKCHSTKRIAVDLSSARFNCLHTNQRRSNLLTLLGDSHALALLPSAVYMARERGVSFFHYSKDACALLVDASNNKSCLRHSEEIVNFIKEISSSYERSTMLLASSYDGSESNPTISNENLERQIEKILLQIRGLNIDLVYIAPAPSFIHFPGSGLCKEQWFSPKRIKSQHCYGSVSKKEILDTRRQLVSMLSSLTRKHTSFHMIDPLDAICERVNCKPLKDGKFIYLDGNHLSAYSAVWLGPHIAKNLRHKRIIGFNN